MFNLKKWFTKESKPDSEPANIHPKHKAIDKKPTSPAVKVKPESTEVKPKDTSLSQKEIHDLRQSEFERLGIPYNKVLMAEAQGVKGIDPRKIAAEMGSINAKLIAFGFSIRISHLECFECQLLYLDYQKLKEDNRRIRGIILPEHSLINIIVLREAEKMIRKKHQLTENPIIDEEAKKFQAEVKALCELFLNKSIEYQLKQQAQRRLRRERDLHINEPLLEADVLSMMEKIKTERAAIGRK